MTDYLSLAQARAPQAAEEQDNPYMPLAQQQQTLQQNRARTVIETALRDDPDLAAERLRVSQTSGVPLRVVERNLDELRVKERARAIDLVNMAQESPVLYRQITDPTFATTSIDDLDTLKNLERSVSKGVRYVMGADGKGGLPSDLGGAAQTVGLGATVGIGKMAFDAAGVVNDLIGWQSGAQAARGTAKQLQGVMDRYGFQPESSTGEAVKSGLQSAGTNLALLPIGLYRGLYSTASQAASVVAGLMAGGVGAAAFNEAREQGRNTLQAGVYAIPEAAFEYVFEKIPATKLFGDIAANTGLLKLLGKQAISEGWTEQVTTLAQDFNQWMNLNPDKTLGQFIQERPEAAYQTFIATLVGVGVQTTTIKGINKIVEKASDTSLKFDQDLLESQMQLAAASMLRQRSPEQFRAHVQNVVDANEGAKKEIYVDAEVLNQLPQELLAQLPESVREALPAALETNSTVAIPMADVLTVAPGTELEQILNDNARMRPNAASRVEAQLTEQYLQQEADRVLQQAADTSAWQQSSETVRTEILGQLNSTGRFTADVNEAYATLQSNFFSTMAARTGMTPTELYQRYSLKVAAKQAGQGGVLNGGEQTNTPAFKAFFGNSKVVDAEGKPLVVYHGTNQAITAFDPAKIGARDAGFFGSGFYFTPDEGQALDYADTAVEDTSEGEAAAMPLYVSLQNPFIWDMSDAGADATRAALASFGIKRDSVRGNSAALGNAKERETFNRAVRAAGFDGVIVQDEDGVQEVVAFEPTQIKSATDNNGQFDPNNPNILGQSATIRRGTETLKKYGLAPGKKYKTREVAAALEARQRAKYGTIAADDRSPEALANISKWMQAEVEFAMDNPESSGVGWYSEKFQRALDTMAQQFPELATDKVARNTMTALIAITSDGQKVVPNFAQAMDIYGNFKTNGKFTTTRGHQRQASIDANLKVIQRLHDQMGAEAMHEYLMQEKTISELKKIAKANGGDLKSDYQAHIKMPMAAVEFGPKLGAFYANLMGAHGYLTMDRWWSRTFNRYRGTLLQAPTRQGLDRFKELLGNPAMSDDEAIAATVEPRNAYEAKGFKNGTELEKAANTIYKAAFENLEDSPFNATDRTFMLDAVNKAQKSLSRKGYNLSVADIQAILWYYEKRLYGELGARQTADISYEEAAQRVVAGYASGSGIESLLDDTGAAPEEDGGADQGRVPVGEETFNAGDVNGELEQAGDRAGRGAGASTTPLPGAPVIQGATGPDPRLVAVAEQYARDNGIDLKRQAEYVQVDPERAARIAQAYDEMQHAPNDPAVQEAYQNLIQQTVAQYRALEAAGYKFWFIDPENDPYKSPFDAMREMRASQTMGVFPTVAGFGSGATDVDITDNPLMGDTGITWPYGSVDGELKPVLANDLFRAVHDAFGHGLEGAGFRAQGEENAWQAHIRLFTGSAVAAITTETRGQNSWVNFGPYGEQNQTAKVEDTVFADQKTGLMPEWTWSEGRAGDMQDDGVFNQDGPLLAPNGQPSNLSPELYALVRTPEFKAWFGDWEAFAGMQGGVWNDTTNSVSKAVDENGEPLVVYHGTDAGGFTEFNTPGGTKRGDLGIFTTPNRAMAASYVKRGRATDITRDQTGEDADRVSGVYPAFVNIRNPYETDFEGALWSGERPGQYSAIDANGETIYAEDGRAYFDDYEDAQALISGKKGASVEGAADHWETTDDAVREARNSGNDGTVIRNVVDEGGGNSSYAGEPSDVFVVLDPTQIKSVENFGSFNPADPNIYKQGPRGTFSPSQLLLTLNENADLSTFLHESGHFFLEVMADLASQANAPQQIRDDMAATLKWFGVPDLTTWNSYTLDQKRPYHERWAESFEQYLFEGKAPSPELQPLFRRFRSWMVNVYKSLTEFMRQRNLKVNDEVRQVFGRLIATDEQIAQAEEAAGMMPDFDATNEAIEALQARSLRDLKWTVRARGKVLKALEKEAKALRKEVEAEVRAEVEQQPLYKAMNWLKKGETTDPATGDVVKAEKGYRLLTTALAEMYPDTMLARPDLTGLRGMTGKEGLHPDMVADMFGFESGDKLVRAILDAEPIGSVIEGMTDQRMLERHGELATPEALEAAANEAVHNEARARSLATELKSQAEMLNPRQDTGRTASNGRAITVNAITNAAKQFAANLAARRRIKDLKNAAWQHRSAEARAGKAWQDATSKGKTEEAVQAKRDQVLNNAAVKALQDAQLEVKKILEFFKRVTKGNDEKVVERGRDPDVVNAMRAILGAYDVAPRLEKTALAYMETVAKNDPAMYAALQPSVQGALLNAKPLGEMTMEELRGLNDELRAMWSLAKSSRQMEVDGNMIDIEEAADQLLERMGEIGIPDTIPGEKGAITDSQERGIKLQFAKAILSRVEQWSERLDGKFGGPFLRLVFQPVKDAADRYRTDKVAYRKKFTELLQNVAPYLPAGPVEAPELGYTFGNARDSGAAELLHAILHTGNDSNKRKLLLGRGWATQDAEGNLDTTKWDNFIQRLASEGTLNPAHFQFAQGVWDLLEEMKPLAQETHRKVFGRYFAEVTANEFVDPFGNVWRGGYLPAQTDSRLVKDAKLRELAEGENESMAYAFPAAPSGFTKSRVEYNQPLLLDLRALGQHMDKVLLFSHMQGAVTDVRRLLTNKRVSYALDRIDPGAYEGMLIPWLNRSARQVVETPVVGDRKLSRFLSAARSRAGMALMFANLSNTVQQITGFTMAGVKVKPGLIMSATARFMADPKAMKTTVADSSPYMKDRMLNEVGAMNDAIEEILIDPTLLERGQAWTQRHAYFMQAAVDNTMSPIIWTAAYNQAIEQKMEHNEAVRFADSVIRQTQGTTLPEDISRFESGPGYARLFTQFVSYFNMMANTNATAVKQIADEVGLKKGAGKVLYVAIAGLLAPIWVAEAIAQAFRGGPEDEDKDGWLDDWLLAVFGLGTLRGLTAQIPIVGQAAQLVINRFNDNPADDKFSLSPAISLIESTVSSPASVYDAIVNDGNKQKAVRDVAAAATMITGLPIYGVARPIGYLAGMAGGNIEPTGPVDLARGIVTGTASPESKQR